MTSHIYIYIYIYIYKASMGNLFVINMFFLPMMILDGFTIKIVGDTTRIKAPMCKTQRLR